MNTHTKSITDRLLKHSVNFGTQTAVTVLPGRPGEKPAVSITYGQLHRSAVSVAAALRSKCRTGDRVILLFPTGIDFVTAFYGCAFAGVIAVPAPLPLNSSRSQRERLQSLLRSSGARLLLTDPKRLNDVESMVTTDNPDAAAVSISTLDSLHEDDKRREHSAEPGAPATLAFLQFTSGSTADPRGVMVSHASLAANVSYMAQFFADGRYGVQCGSWLPLYHDMGLIGGLLTPLYFAGHAVLLSPYSFLRDPSCWLRMIDDHRVELSIAPNFAYELCVRRVKEEQIDALDLSSWRIAINGAEPIHAATIESFRDRFEPAGFRAEAMCPAYGMAEVGLFVTGTPPATLPVVRAIDAERLQQDHFTVVDAGKANSRKAVSSGRVPEHFDVKVVDPVTRTPLPEGRIGEVWLKGPSVAVGYWNDAVETEATFAGHTSEGEGPYLRTGDLGTCYDGELYVTGRLKELIIVSGRNVYPQDLERGVVEIVGEQAPGASAAFAVPCDNVEKIVVVLEVDKKSVEPDLRRLCRAVKEKLSEQAGVPVANVCLIPFGGIRRSTSGKIRRTYMRELFITGKLEPMYEDLEPAMARRTRSMS